MILSSGKNLNSTLTNQFHQHKWSFCQEECVLLTLFSKKSMKQKWKLTVTISIIIKSDKYKWSYLSKFIPYLIHGTAFITNSWTIQYNPGAGTKDILIATLNTLVACFKFILAIIVSVEFAWSKSVIQNFWDSNQAQNSL